MTKSVLSFALSIGMAAGTASCSPTNQSNANQGLNVPPNTQTTTQNSAMSQSQSNSSLPVAPAHGNTSAAPVAATAPSQDSGPTGIDTAAYDAKIKKAEEKASSKNATEADKKAAAAAYLERANIFYSAQQPSLYKFALGDFRKTLKYDPSNEEAKAKMDQIVSIYNQLGRPVPSNGL
jgi:hypothetical protein